MTLQIPGYGDLNLETLILDLNGTLSVGGQVVPGVKERLETLKLLGLRIILFTGNTRNDADNICTELGIEWQLAQRAQDKADLAKKLNPSTCVSIGNGRIDLELVQTVKLRIVTLQAEGVHVQTLQNSDIVVPTVLDALDLLIDTPRLIATLRS